MSSRLKIGIVGCGGITQHKHIPSFMRLKRNVVIEAVCDTNENLARETAARYHITKAYSELSEMLSVENLDIIDICTPPQAHTSLATEALEHGCHVVMEKPMALTTADCDRMIDTARQRGVKLCVIHNNLFEPPFIKAKKLVAEGAIGKFIGMRILMSDFREAMILKKDHWIHKLPGGLIGETGPHAAYMSLAFLKEVKAVDIYAKNFLEHPWAPFDELRIELEGEEAMSSVVISYASNRHSNYIDIFGTDGVLYLSLPSKLLVYHGKKESMRPIPFARYSSNIAFQIAKGVTANAFKLATGKLELSHYVLLERFIDSILNDRQPPVTAEDGRETVRVMEMIVKRLNKKYGT